MDILQPSLEYGCEVWNINNCQDKTLETIQLRAGSVTTCDEPMCADLGLETFKSGRDFQTLKWYCKVKHTNNQRLPGKLLTNRWDSVKCKGHPRKSWLTQVDSLMKDLDLQDKDLAVKLIRDAINKSECGQFETSLQQSQNCKCIYRVDNRD